MGYTQKLGLLAQSVFQDSSLNVGIGAAPSGTYKLEVTGTAKVSSTLLVSGASTLTGAVGVGIAAPSSGLEVYVSGGGPTIRVTNSGTGTGSSNGFHIGTDGTAPLDVAFVQNENASQVFYTNDGTSTAERLRIRSGGQVAIGGVQSTDTTGALLTFPMGAFVYWGANSSGNTRNWAIRNNELSTGDFAIKSSSTNTGALDSVRFQITKEGNVGIGGVAPASQATGATSGILDVSAATGGNLVLHRNGSGDTALFSILKSSNGTYIDSTGAATAANNAIYFRTNNNNADQTSLTTALKISSAGVTTLYNNNGAFLEAVSANAAVFFMLNNSAGTNRGYFGFGSTSTTNMNLWNIEDGSLLFGTANTLKMTLTNAGALQVSKNTLSDSVQIFSNVSNGTGTTGQITLNQAVSWYTTPQSGGTYYSDFGGDSAGLGYRWSTYSGSYANRFFFYANGTAYNSTGTWGNSSDIKLKQDIVDANPQWDDIKALKFKKYRLKKDVETELKSTDGYKAPVHFGLIAQDVELTSPGLIEDITDADGTTKMIKTSIMLMKSVKALQEAMIKIESLQEQINELKNK